MASYMPEPLASYSPLDINIDNAARMKDKRWAAKLRGAGPEYVSNDEGWDSLYGGLDRAREAANEQGQNFRLSTAGIGGQGESMTFADLDQGARSRALNEYLTDSATKFRLGQATVRGANAQAMGAEDAVREAATDRMATDYAFQDPKASRDEILARIPGRFRQQVEKFYADRDAQQAGLDLAGRKQSLLETDQSEKARLAAAAQRETERHNRMTEGGRNLPHTAALGIADLDASLDDLVTLRNSLGTTGTKSKVGADAPNWITDLTGWGLSEDAKSRQAVIDRVRQVIGKALEGGVLRKEDEEKYKKILPTMGDPPAVAKSKLDGLEKAIIERRETQLDALRDANYNVERFNRAPPAPGAQDPAAGGKGGKDPLGIR